MPTFPTKELFEAIFEPKMYLNEYFGEPDDEDRFAIRFITSMLRKMPSGILTLEFGGGPTLYSVAAIVSRSREIHFCDYVNSNLKEVHRWLNNEPDAFDWRPYIKLILQAEGRPVTPESVAQRETEIRQRVTRLITCDARARTPLGREASKYDLVAAHHCTDVAAATVSEWVQVLCNVSTLVVPGGWLLISVTTGSRTYSVGQKEFPCVDLTAEEIYHGYMVAGYDSNSFQLDREEVSIDREYSGIIMAIARKPS